MIPRKIRKPAAVNTRILFLLATGLLTMLTLAWTAHLPIWLRGGLGLLIASTGLFVVFGGWGGRSVPQVVAAALQYALRPHCRAWARGQRAALIGVLRRPSIWWWRLVEKVTAFLTPARQTIAAGIVAALVTLAIMSLVGWSFWARAGERDAFATPVPTFFAISALAQTLPAIPIVDTPVPITSISPGPAPLPPTPVASVFDVAWQGSMQPGYLRLSPTSGPTTVTLVFVGAGVQTQTLWLERDTAVPLVPAFHPTLTQVQVLGPSPIQVEQVAYAPYRCALACAWWLWVDPSFSPAFSPAHLVLRPGMESLAELPGGEARSLAAGRGNRLPLRLGLYRITGTEPFCLEFWFER